jgi:thiol-disulfide isomerase/thioredoxin
MTATRILLARNGLRALVAALLLFLAGSALAPAARAQGRPSDDQRRYQQLFQEGIELLGQKRYDESADRFKRAIELRPDSFDCYYNVACALSLKGDKGAAIDWLEKAIAKGFDDAKHIDEDSDLDPIRGEARFLELMSAKFGRPKPGESLRTLKGDVASLDKLKGKVVIVCFWRSWVDPCKQEVPTLIELAKEHGEKGLVVVGISNEPVEVQEQIADELKVSYLLLRETGPLPAPMENVRAFPTKFILDRDGKCVKKLVAARDKAELEAIVLPLLSGKKSEPEVF